MNGKPWLAVALFAAACNRQPPAQDTWLRGDAEARFGTVAKQLRGFDVAMVEVGYRYAELYWAGRDRNWRYAEYQIDKIRTAVQLAVERRPKRGASAAMLESALAPLEAAAKKQGAAEFSRRFDQLTATCNACHQAEAVAFMRVETPRDRRSAIRGSMEREE